MTKYLYVPGNANPFYKEKVVPLPTGNLGSVSRDRTYFIITSSPTSPWNACITINTRPSWMIDWSCTYYGFVKTMPGWSLYLLLSLWELDNSVIHRVKKGVKRIPCHIAPSTPPTRDGATRTCARGLGEGVGPKYLTSETKCLPSTPLPPPEEKKGPPIDLLADKNMFEKEKRES